MGSDAKQRSGGNHGKPGGSLLTIDGSMGEGGGQVLRSALTLSMATGRAFRIRRVRASRSTPGLRAQHLTAVRAAAEICSAEVEGVSGGSVELEFHPGGVRAGSYRFATGTAGSAILVLQTVLPPLLTAPDGPSSLTVVGGTHNPAAPPWEFFEHVWLGRLRGLGARVRSRLVRPGFYPAGGGQVKVDIEPVDSLYRMNLIERGDERRRTARAIVSGLPRHIAEREVSVLHAFLGLRADALEIVEVAEEEAAGPGNAVMASLEFTETTEVFTGFGEKGVPAEEVALRAGRAALDWLRSEAPVGPHLADQLLVPLAIGAGGRFVASERTSHAGTQTRLLERFLDRTPRWSERPDGTWVVEVDAR